MSNTTYVVWTYVGMVTDGGHREGLGLGGGAIWWIEEDADSLDRGRTVAGQAITYSVEEARSWCEKRLAPEMAREVMEHLEYYVEAWGATG